MPSMRVHAAAIPRSRSRARGRAETRGGRPDLDALVVRLRNAARRCIGDDVCELSAGGPRFLWLHGSTMVEAVAGDDGSVLLRAFLVLAPAPSDRLAERLAAYAERIDEGLRLDGDGDIVLERRVAAGADASRLDAAIREISHRADLLDDLLCVRFGGIRSVDRLRRDILLALGPDN